MRVRMKQVLGRGEAVAVEEERRGSLPTAALGSGSHTGQLRFHHLPIVAGRGRQCPDLLCRCCCTGYQEPARRVSGRSPRLTPSADALRRKASTDFSLQVLPAPSRGVPIGIAFSPRPVVTGDIQANWPFRPVLTVSLPDCRHLLQRRRLRRTERDRLRVMTTAVARSWLWRTEFFHFRVPH